MTAEIAIINRSAVTLATDSAVTLTVRGVEKIYNAADKLFELSEINPIGVMIYNNLEFMGVDLEVAITQFRRKTAAVSFQSVVEAASAFFEFLATDPATASDEEIQREHVRALIQPLLKEINFVLVTAARRELSQGNTRINFSTVYTDAMRKLTSDLEAIVPASCFSTVPVNEVLDAYSDVIDQEIERTLGSDALNLSHRNLLRGACALTLHRNTYSDVSTGIVFAGFGAGELSPSLVAYEIDGIICGRLKNREINRVATGRSEMTGEILPFAQREMVDRFLYGIDPIFESGIEGYMRALMEKTASAIVDAVPRASKRTREMLEQAASAGADTALQWWRDQMVPAVKQQFMREIQDMVFLMPKQELAALAEELINLTSVKRKFSSGIESVGGPIDVALISRVDGFVWVRRKHYFDASLNPGYFKRRRVSVGSEELR